MIKKYIIIILFSLLSINANAFELVKVESNQEFNRIPIWSGSFVDYSNKAWDVSEYYINENDTFNASFYFNHKTDKLTFTSKFYYDNGYDSVLQDVDPLYFLSISTKYKIEENISLKLVVDPVFKIGGSSSESPCHDDFNREYHCGTGLAWSDAVSGNYLKSYDLPTQVNLIYAISF